MQIVPSAFVTVTQPVDLQPLLPRVGWVLLQLCRLRLDVPDAKGRNDPLISPAPIEVDVEKLTNQFPHSIPGRRQSRAHSVRSARKMVDTVAFSFADVVCVRVGIPFTSCTICENGEGCNCTILRNNEGRCQPGSAFLTHDGNTTLFLSDVYLTVHRNLIGYVYVRSAASAACDGSMDTHDTSDTYDTSDTGHVYMNGSLMTFVLILTVIVALLAWNVSYDSPLRSAHSCGNEDFMPGNRGNTRKRDKVRVKGINRVNSVSGMGGVKQVNGVSGVNVINQREKGTAKSEPTMSQADKMDTMDKMGGQWTRVVHRRTSTC